MTENVLVVHGVANRDEAKFVATVQALEARLNERATPSRRYALVAAYWGDLAGGDGKDLHDALPPSMLTNVFGVRGDSEFDVLVNHIYNARKAVQSHAVRSQDDVARIVTDAARSRTATETAATFATRSGTLDDADLAQAVAEAIGASTYIRGMRDLDLLQSVGAVVGASLSSSADESIETRGMVSGVRDTVKRVIGAIDTLLGAVTSEALGAFNQVIRGALAAATALSFGDIVAYRDSANGERIRQRVLDRLLAKHIDPQQPLIIIAHSLGGLVVLDLLLAARLSAKRLITCGSQPAMFHVLKPLDTLAPYRPEHSSVLPATIAAWTNLWHPMDVLAFVTSPVFALASGAAPVDIEIKTPVSTILEDKLWMHSAYWTSQEMISAVLA